MYDFPLRGFQHSRGDVPGWNWMLGPGPFLLIFGRFASSFQVKLEWKLYIFKQFFHLDMYTCIYIYIYITSPAR